MTDITHRTPDPALVAKYHADCRREIACRADANWVCSACGGTEYSDLTLLSMCHGAQLVHPETWKEAHPHAAAPETSDALEWARLSQELSARGRVEMAEAALRLAVQARAKERPC